jgi:uncharacterized membrane protein YadS
VRRPFRAARREPYGVSGAIAIGGAVGAKKEQVSIAISLAVFWAIVMIFALPLVARALHLPPASRGAAMPRSTRSRS